MKTILGKHFEVDDFETNLNEFRLEHMEACDSGERCQSCRALRDETLISRLQLARTEYVEKIEPLSHLRGLLCVYCGGHSNERDHLLPRNWTGDGLRKFVPTVPACRFCNGTLNDFPEPFIVARAGRIARRIREKHRRELHRPLRTEVELQEFGFRLQQSLRAMQESRIELHAKLKVLDFGGVPELPPALIDWLTVGDYGQFLGDPN